MGNEKRLVVNPLKIYFLDPKRSGAKWLIKDEPNYERSATGWDLQVERKNQVLLIEAKYIRGPSASALAGLLIAPLTKKQEKMRSKKKKSWSSVVCWAIGCGYEKGGRAKKYQMGGISQILFDYFIRNIEFWNCYSEILKVKYIYFVDNKKVAKILFAKILVLAKLYKTRASTKKLEERRVIADELIERFLKFI